MGILNVTADSFSDGGCYLDVDRAVAHGLDLVADGANLVDVGGESTRPGAQRVPAEIEAGRVVPVVRDLARSGARVSIDTTRSSVARAAVDAGACLVNDVSGGLADAAMATCVADLGVPYVAMHWRAPSSDMHLFTSYDDVVTDVIGELSCRLEALAWAGVDLARVIVDPGLGFAKTAEQNWAILGRLDEFEALGRPVLIGASRKSFLGAELARDGAAPPPAERDTASAAVSAIAAFAGVYCLRVHDVRESVQAAQIAAAVRRGQAPARPALTAPPRSPGPRVPGGRS